MFLTVRDAILKAFPQGTRPDVRDATERDITEPPIWPPDLFAVTALLLQQSGAYHHVVASDIAANAPAGSLVITAADLTMFRQVGKRWAWVPSTPPEVGRLWKRLTTSGASPLCALGRGARTPITWWRDAYALMAISDEACADVGYRPDRAGSDDDRWIMAPIASILKGNAPRRPKSRHQRHVDQRPSITSPVVDQDVVCVQPKARTPDVGCSLRNLSHNLVLLPPRGVMRVHWLLPPAVQPVDEKTPLELLLIPFPYRIESGWFRAQPMTGAGVAAPWGWFDLDQEWLDQDGEDIVALVRALLDAPEAKGIGGVVLPEYALSYPIYERLAAVLRDHYPGVQFLVSGASSNCGGESGNFALASHFFEDSQPAQGGAASQRDATRMMATVSRPKHHRWSLDWSQIGTYDLASVFSALPKDARWWENIPLKPRELHVNAMRSASVFTVMICEDLARSDPAHEPLRSVGPNLVFVLLMDGPQLPARWAGRYSTGLADDPGSSVLTLTSRGLLARSNARCDPEEQSWSVALWKDEASRARELRCPPGNEALIVQLTGKRQVERTIDGRDNTHTYAWHLEGPDQVRRIRLDRKKHGDLLKRLGALPDPFS